ncbi:MAG TPA: cytochrome b5 domain-containing protein [Clostridium sp.]
MSIYFDFKTINELIEDNCYREQKEFTLEELSQYDGSSGKPAYVAIEGIVYDLSKVSAWAGGTHFGLTAGEDLTEQFNSCHGMIKILKNIPKVGIIIEKNSTQQAISREVETYDFSPDDWVGYITPLVNSALEEANGGVNLEHLFQKFILIGIFVGQGKTFQEAIDQVERWEDTGISQLLEKSKMNKG